MRLACRPIVLGLITAALTGTLAPVSAPAASPASIQRGMQLFARDWQRANPRLGSDGLGPLFNGQGCLTCHNQGGVGGGGAAEFNAHTIGIEWMRIVGGAVDNDVIKRSLRSFHPGFVQSDGTVINTLALSHHGGTSRFAEAREQLLSQLPAEFSPQGGPTTAAEVRYATATPILFNNTVGNYQIALRARLYQRNTTAIFGAGLIDQVPDRLLKEQERVQKSHPEISGRPSTLRDGRFGKFGWRANVASLIEFTDQACANEVGLETRRKPQAADPMNPSYRNPGIDVSDQQIVAMRDFMSSLPTPIRQVPSDSAAQLEGQRGEQLFASVGCAVCHVPSLGPANGIYSDLLLHDMGYELVDLNHAEPYILRATPQKRISFAGTEQVSGTRMVGGYYGPASEITVNETSSLGRTGDFTSSNGPSRSIRSNGFEFSAPTFPTSRMQLVDIGQKEFVEEQEFQTENHRGVRDATVKRTTVKRATYYLRLHFEPTQFNQEWRTPPLWGVRDSAPYMHDGRAETLLEAISMHDGESAGTRDRFLQLSLEDRNSVILFLNTLIASPHSPPAAI